MVVIVLGIAAGAYFIFQKKDKPKTKDYYADRIIAAGKHSSKAGLLNMDLEFLKAWVELGIDKKAETFPYQGKNYYTQGGTAA